MTYDYSDRRAGKQAAVKLTRTQRRQFEKLTARIDKVIQADRFFELFSNRQHRVGLAADSVHETPRPDASAVGPKLETLSGVEPGLSIKIAELIKPNDGFGAPTRHESRGAS